MTPLGMYNTTVSVSRKTQTQSTSTGAKVSTWATVATGQAAAVQMSTSSEDRAYMRETGRTRYRVFMVYGVDVRTGDRLTWGSRTLSVLGPPIDEAGRQSHYALAAEEVEGGGTL